MSSDLPDGVLDPGGDRGGGGSGQTAGEEVTFRRFTIVRIGSHRLALPVDSVRTVIDPPETSTRIPRTPPAITGVTDVRGQITVLVDPHVHFPDSGGPSANQSLLVFDRPEQPAAIYVDEIHGVEAVPDDAVVDADEYDEDEVNGTALAHPLITAALRIEHHRRDLAVEPFATGSAEESETDDRQERSPLADPSDNSSDDGVEVGEFSLEEDEPDEPERRESEVEIDVVPLLDVDRLLLASGDSDDAPSDDSGPEPSGSVRSE